MLCLDRQKERKKERKKRGKKLRRIENKKKHFFTIDIQMDRKREKRK